MMRLNTAPRSERKTFNVVFLGVIFASVVNLPARRDFVAHRQAAYFSCRRNVAFHERGRYLQAADDIVEANRARNVSNLGGWPVARAIHDPTVCVEVCASEI